MVSEENYQEMGEGHQSSERKIKSTGNKCLNAKQTQDYHRRMLGPIASDGKVWVGEGNARE